MSRQAEDLLDRWLREVRSVDVVLTGATVRDADANMLVFSLSEARASGVLPEQLDEFLLRAYRHFSGCLSPLGTDVWFYAWHDEMSGTLRCSVCQVSSATQLPFACRKDVVGVPTPVSAAALSSSYSDGIPRNELLPEESWQQGEGEFELTVFARRLISAVHG